MSVTTPAVNIRGIDTLGRGFNLFGPDTTDIGATLNNPYKAPLIAFAYPTGDAPYRTPYQGGTWVDQNAGQGTEYLIPMGVAINDEHGPMETEDKTFISARQVEQYLAQRADVTVTYGAFRGSAEVQLAMKYSSETSYLYVFRGQIEKRWSLTLDPKLNAAPTSADGGTTVEPGVAAALRALPTACTAATIQAFRDFFTRYGTHYVVGVDLGARTRLFVAAQTSKRESATDVMASVEAEYANIVAGKAEAEWDAKTRSFEQTTEQVLMVFGGDSNYAAELAQNPGAGTYSVWHASVGQHPSVIDIALAGVWELAADPSVAQALQEAYTYFALRVASVPLYRFTSGSSSGLCYLGLDAKQHPKSPSNWSADGVVGYVLPPDPSGGPPPSLAGRYNPVALTCWTGKGALPVSVAWYFYTANPSADPLYGYTQQPGPVCYALEATGGAAPYGLAALNRLQVQATPKNAPPMTLPIYYAATGQPIPPACAVGAQVALPGGRKGPVVEQASGCYVLTEPPIASDPFAGDTTEL